MRRLLITILSASFLMVTLASIALFIGGIRSSFAQDKAVEAQNNLLSVSSYEKNHPQHKTEAMTTSGLKLDSEAEQTKEEIVTEIQGLSEQWMAANKQYGWYHAITQHREDYDLASILPDEKPSAKEYTMDYWVLLDEQGYQEKGVFIQHDLAGNPIQISIFRDQSWYNLTYKEIVPVPEEALPQTFRLDFGFPNRAAQSSKVEKVETNLEEKAVYLYTATYLYDSPLEIADFKSPTIASITKAYLDPVSGALRLLEDHLVLANGEERVRNSVQLISFEKGVQPPSEIFGHLEATYTDTFKDLSQAP